MPKQNKKKVEKYTKMRKCGKQGLNPGHGVRRRQPQPLHHDFQSVKPWPWQIYKERNKIMENKQKSRK